MNHKAATDNTGNRKTKTQSLKFQEKTAFKVELHTQKKHYFQVRGHRKFTINVLILNSKACGYFSRRERGESQKDGKRIWCRFVTNNLTCKNLF